jgi:hypothetical protein
MHSRHSTLTAGARSAKLELSRGSRGPAARARLTPDECAVADLILRGVPDGIALFARAIGASEDHAAKVVAGTKAPPGRFDFEALTQAVEPACTPTRTCIDLGSIGDPLRAWMLWDRFQPYLSPRTASERPRVTVSVDRVVLIATDEPSLRALYERFPTLGDGRSREERLAVDGGGHVHIRIERGSKPAHLAKPHDNYEHVLRFKVFTANGPRKLVARLSICPRRVGLPAIRFEITGEGSSRGLALALARVCLHPFVGPGSLLIQYVEVALDLEVAPHRVIIFHDPQDHRRVLSNATGTDHGGPIALHLGGALAAYDKIAELLAHCRFVPAHAKAAQHLFRVEARLRRGHAGFDGRVDAVVACVQARLAEMCVADLASQPTLGTTAWMLDLVRRHGIAARSSSLKRKSEWLSYPRRYGLQGAVFAELRVPSATRKARRETDAHARSVLIHAWTLARVRELAARTPWSLAEMFDRDAANRIELLLRALVGEATASESTSG